MEDMSPEGREHNIKKELESYTPIIGKTKRREYGKAENGKAGKWENGKTEKWGNGKAGKRGKRGHGPKTKGGRVEDMSPEGREHNIKKEL